MSKAEVLENRPLVLGINGLGRIGKLTLWHHIGRKYFKEIVVNVGREVGKDMSAVAQVIEKDATYGLLHRFLYGIKAEKLIQITDEKKGKLLIDGIPVTVLREARNPKDIPWRDHGVEIVAECTGKFGDPTVPFDSDKGSIKGHLAGGGKDSGQFLGLQDQEQGTHHARRGGDPHLRDQPPRPGREEAQAHIGRVLHHHGPCPHGEAASGE